MATAQIPDPPAGEPWVERHRGVDTNGCPYIFCESEADDCWHRSVELMLRSDGRRKYFEWGIVSEIAGSKADVPDWWQRAMCRITALMWALSRCL
jgi:hypothetical protein